jgi:hypothetical protein
VADKRRNGVVGRTGTKMPAIPNPNVTRPIIVRIIFTASINFKAPNIRHLDEYC